MIAALWFYGQRSARNRIVKRTRDVRYVAGMVLIFAYLYFVFGRSMRRESTSGSQGFVVLGLLLAGTARALRRAATPVSEFMAGVERPR